MSWQASGWVKKLIMCPNGEKITKNEKFLLLTMADDYVEHNSAAEVSVRELAEYTRGSERQIRYTLRRLEKKGLIETWVGGPGKTSIYKFPAYLDGANPAPKVKNQHGAKIAPCMGQKLPGANSSMGQSGAGHGAKSSSSPPQTPPLLSSLSSKTDKTDGEGEEPRPPLNNFSKDLGWSEEDLWLFEYLQTAEMPYGMQRGYLMDPCWWRSVGRACGGLDVKFIDEVFGSLNAAIFGGSAKQPVKREEWEKTVRSWLITENNIRLERKRKVENRSTGSRQGKTASTG